MLNYSNYLRPVVLGVAFIVAAVAAQVSGSAQAEAADYYNGFETDTSGWLPNGLGITRVPSTTNGVTSKTGSFHAEVDGCGIVPGDCSSAFTRWGGYQNTFPPFGYTTSVDIYLDLPSPPGPLVPNLQNDMRFDFSSAINNPGGAHRRDFVFNAGYYNDTDGTGSGPRYVISASNNATRSGAFPKNPGRSPFTINVEGWYTFEHRFDNVAGVLVVTMSVKNAAGLALHSWVLSNPSDIIGLTVGGNRYGWFAINEFDFLAIDNSRKEEVKPEDEVDHFACYDVEENTKMPKRTVTLESQFGSIPNAEISETKMLCAPVNKNGEGIIFEGFHLTCYEVNKGNDPQADVRVDNQFGQQDLEVKKLKTLCVPSTKQVLE